jgi:hypothetical protein
LPGKYALKSAENLAKKIPKSLGISAGILSNRIPRSFQSNTPLVGFLAFYNLVSLISELLMKVFRWVVLRSKDELKGVRFLQLNVNRAIKLRR